MIKSTFALDLWKEKELIKYLDIVYSKLDFNINRVDDKTLQREGIDLYLSNNRFENIIVDEKAQLSYIDKTLHTFAFELGYILNNTQKKGWLFDIDKKTQYYMLICNIKTINENMSLKDNKIKSFELLLINRDKLIKYLCENNISEDEVKIKEREYRAKNLNGKIKIDDEGKFYFYLTQSLAEKPFNIVIKKEELKKISDFFKIINLNFQ